MLPQPETLAKRASSNTLYFFTVVHQNDRGGSAYGPFTSEEAREKAVRLYFEGEDISVLCILTFVELTPTTLKMTASIQLIDDFKTPVEGELDMLAKANEFHAFCDAQRQLCLDAAGTFLLTITAFGPEVAGPYYDPQAVNQAATSILEGDGPISLDDNDLFAVRVAQNGHNLTVETLSLED